ncbi:hypothetical protein EDF54_0148 [Rathayibacter sp. PhB93]|uniref:hypothetical protein n=1 Tax=unclassified Rathayibacter TaxID=2609250 RepID=UPI000FBC69C0|nr:MULTISPECIES: hypothetical protein [unclassified Rathayibacter]ROQ17025.1 hypothetical protein EDF54_0148 [Rathayibacter sp. PhB93]TDQ06759.1 hypothetical protein EDF17_3752 [Rathayibacter sp. PhB1]
MPPEIHRFPPRHGLTRRGVVLGGLAVLPLLSACTFDSTSPSDSEPQEAPRTQAAAPAGPVALAADAASASALLFTAAPLVVVVEDVPASVLLAAQVSIAWGVPLLVESAGSTSTATASASPSGSSIDAELARLGTTRVVAVGAVAERAGVDTVTAAAEAAAIEEATGVAVGALDAASLASLVALAPGAPAEPPFGALPARAEPLAGVTALAQAADVAAVANARAVGVPVSLVDDGVTDLLASGSAVTAIADAGASCTLLLGPVLAAQSLPEWSVRAAASGWQLPGGGQRLFGGHLYVAIYGTPGAPVLGVLGEQGLDATIARAEAVAEPYRSLTDLQVVPSLEIITTVAAGSAGGDGDYSNELEPSGIRPYIDAAAAAGMYVVLDLQPGRSDFLSQAQAYEELLRLPNVGLALDPEWRLAPDEVPLAQIGRVQAAEVDSVSSWLADLVQREGLPPKMFVLHQFRLSMLQDRDSIRRDRPELEFLIHVDGQGGQPDKQATWNALHEGAPEGIAWGWKNFYDEDLPMLTPAQTMSEVAPLPDLITYQ